jgi:hypothetical protein
VDVEPGSRRGFLDKKIAQPVIRGQSKEKRLDLDMKGRNDLGDWKRGFAHRFAKPLRELPGRDSNFRIIRSPQ